MGDVLNFRAARGGAVVGRSLSTARQGWVAIPGTPYLASPNLPCLPHQILTPPSAQKPVRGDRSRPGVGRSKQGDRAGGRELAGRE